VCGAPFLGTSFAVSEFIAKWGDEPLRQTWLPQLAGGELIGTFAFTEKNDIAPRSPVVRYQDGRLFGSKLAVVAGSAAALAVVLAADASGAALLAIADLRQPGVTRETLETIDNSRCTATLDFDGLPATPVVAADGHAAAFDLLSRYALFVAAEQVGGAEACMELARDYANERHAFGQPIGKFQAVKHAIAEVYVQVQIARANVFEAAWSLSQGNADLSILAAAARVSATEAYETSARQTTQIHGGIGVTWESDIHLHYRRSRVLALECGAAHVWEDRLVDELERAA
jgi:alkylation response protein AidB-like acyl-CoA dehydrogenase